MEFNYGQQQNPYGYGTGFGMPFGMGMSYQPQPQERINNRLSQEEMEMLKAKTEKFRLGLNQEEVLRARCNHRTADGTNDTLEVDPATGLVRCQVCGYTFRPIDADEDPEAITESVERVIDILQTIKLMFNDITPDSYDNFFPIISMLMKVPELYKIASQSFAKKDYAPWMNSGYNMDGIQKLGALSSMFGGGMFGMGMPMGAPQQSAPMPNPAFQQPQAPMGAPMGQMSPMMGQPNPFGYAGAQPQQAPWGYQAQNYSGYTPQAPVAPAPVTANAAAPNAPAGDAKPVVEQNVNV